MSKKGIYSCSRQVVNELNYYQVSSAERFSFCCVDEFCAWGVAPNRIRFD